MPALLLALAVASLLGGGCRARAAEPCSPPEHIRPSPHPPDLRPWREPQASPPSQASRSPSPSSGNGGDYRHLLGSTVLGWPRLDSWCVWVEPAGDGPGGRWDRRWLEAVLAALAQWQSLLPMQRTDDPEAAQVRVRRVRPPLRQDSQGGLRASHGRALLRLIEVRREGRWTTEPQVEVLISPGQRSEAIQATALHELGHAFGLWGHSDDPNDAMGVSPGARPVLELTERDRTTLRWLYSQPTRFGRTPPAPPPGSRLPEEPDREGATRRALPIPMPEPPGQYDRSMKLSGG